MKRNPWNLLTGRGKLFLIVGLAVLIASMLLGQRDVLWLGWLFILLPIIAVLLIGSTRLQLTCERSSDHDRIEIGDQVEEVLVLDKQASRIPTGLLLFEDHLPQALGARPRFTVTKGLGAWQRRISYPLTGHQRGRFSIGPLLVRSTDAFGLVQFDRQFSATSELLVTPKVHKLGMMRNVGGGGASGETRPQRLGAVGQDDVLIREYREGDDVRRVHWRSTARRGELMVRREEQAWDPSMTLVLDNRASRHAGYGPESSFEEAVSIAASVALHFQGDGYDVDIYDIRGPMIPGLISRQITADHLLLAYTDVVEVPDTEVSGELKGALNGQNGQLILAVMGRMTVPDAELLLRSRRNRAQAMLVVLDVDSFTAPADRISVEARSEHDAAVELLRSHHWRISEVRRGLHAPDVWTSLERMGERV
ncbi:DUF58 domain-containing protein [Granulicoccus phenolivorans]|uniref:DUF58 domain-containing protein n=1 Tax=Granulicoccus phenolivorans TaxID=266854 RepID=UPI000409E9C9|nr:DUF58 domain-containing protein [Granulicoccus phenolivorans]